MSGTEDFWLDRRNHSCRTRLLLASCGQRAGLSLCVAQRQDPKAQPSAGTALAQSMGIWGVIWDSFWEEKH